MTFSVSLALLTVTLAAILACASGTSPDPTQTPTTPPDPTATASPPEPTATLEPIVIPTPEHQPAVNSTSSPIVITRVPDITLVPTIDPPLVPFPVELTGGLDALAACGGYDPEYWFSVGPPDITPELAECILAYLEGN